VPETHQGRCCYEPAHDNIVQRGCAGIKVSIKLDEGAHQQAKDFVRFLQRVARKHSAAISISAGTIGHIECSVPLKEGEKFGLFLQELMLNQGVYYYLCSVPNRRKIANSVVRPIFQELLEAYFQVTYPSLLRRHLEGRLSGSFAGDFTDETGQQYDVLVHRLKLKVISGYEFVRDLDDLLTEFMLFQLEYSPGDKSPKFNLLVDQCGKNDILRDKEIRKRFNRVHFLRTRGLHRLEKEIPDSEISQIALQFYIFFEYLKDYWEAQEEKTVVLQGKRYRRIRYGKEPVQKEFELTWSEMITRPCGDCEVIQGELHLDGCDIEMCPRCFGQFLGCECKREDDWE
jgi:hypothetical protein